MKKIFAVLPVFLLVLDGCGEKFQSFNSSSVASSLGESVACPNSRSQIFDAYAQAYRGSTDLSLSAFASAAKAQAFTSTDFAKASPEVQAKFQKSLTSLHKLMTVDLAALKANVQAQNQNQNRNENQAPEQNQNSSQGQPGDETSQSLATENEDDELLHLARLEMHSQIDPSYSQLNAKIDAALAQAAVAAEQAGVSCQTSGASTGSISGATTGASTGAGDPASPAAPAGAVAFSLPATSPIFGAHYAMATAYQSCQVLGLPLVDASTANVQGVVRGAKIDVGYGRVYTDVTLLKRTHYYHRGQTYGPSCANQDKAPLVYDYGGKPVITASGALDFFTNSGGGPALGVDCSAFVSTAAAIAGNLYRTSTANKATYTRFVSRDFINPRNSGWTCYDSVKVAPNLFIQAGDIAAIQGHVVMIDQVGSDPFGLANVKTPSECSALSYKNFDFAIIQSSPSKNSMGINRFTVKDYLVGEPHMQNMFTGYAQQACLSKFDKLIRTPVTSAYGIIRHKQIASCLAPKIELRNESCISSCSALNN